MLAEVSGSSLTNEGALDSLGDTGASRAQQRGRLAQTTNIETSPPMPVRTISVSLGSALDPSVPALCVTLHDGSKHPPCSK